MKKNKSERVDLYGNCLLNWREYKYINYNFNNFRLFGNEDVDLRTLGVDSDSSGTLASVVSDKKSASKAVSCFNSVRLIILYLINQIILEGRKFPSITCQVDGRIYENGPGKDKSKSKD